MRTLLLAPVAALLFAGPLSAQLKPPAAAVNDSTRPVTPAPSAAFQAQTVSSIFARATQGEEDVTFKGGIALFGQDVTLSLKALLNEDGPTELVNVGGLRAGTTLTLGWGDHRPLPGLTNRRRIAWCEGLAPEIRKGVNCQDPRTYGSAGTGTVAFPDKVAATYPSRDYLLWEVTGELGHDDLKFLDGTTFALEEEDRYSGSIGLNMGYLRRGLLLGTGARWEGSWEEEDEAEVCAPIGGGGATRCHTAPLGAPAYKREVVIGAQARRFIGSGFGYHLQLDYRPQNGAWSTQLPLYFAPDDDGALIGGVAPGFDFKRGEFSLSVFVGTALSIGL